MGKEAFLFAVKVIYKYLICIWRGKDLKCTCYGAPGGIEESEKRYLSGWKGSET